MDTPYRTQMFHRWSVGSTQPQPSSSRMHPATKLLSLCAINFGLVFSAGYHDGQLTPANVIIPGLFSLLSGVIGMMPTKGTP